MRALFTQHIRHGKYKEDQVRRVVEHIEGLVTAEKMEYTIVITQFDRSKSAAQLGYYNAVIIPEFMRFQGCSAKEAKKVLKDELLTPVISTILGKTVETRASIADMKLKEMSEYIDNCINFMGTLGIAVPPPPYKEHNQ